MGVRTTCLDPRDVDVPYLPVVTVGAKFKGRGVITCTEFYEPFTHYIGGRTLPCLTPTCSACDNDRPRRYEGFVSVVWMVSRKHEIVRLTKPAMLGLKLGLEGRDFLRGQVLLLERKGTRNCGRLVASVEREALEISRLPPAPDLPAHLARIWRVDGMEVSKDETGYIRQLSAFVAEATAAQEAKHAQA